MKSHEEHKKHKPKSKVLKVKSVDTNTHAFRSTDHTGATRLNFYEMGKKF